MFARTVIIAATLAVAPSAYAASSAVTDLARDTGVTERQIRMVIGARTAFAEYRSAFNHVERHLKARLGDEGYARLVDGDAEAVQRILRQRDATAALRAPAAAAAATQARGS